MRKQTRFGSLVPFTWRVAADGYRWVSSGRAKSRGRFLVPIPTTRPDRTYKPLEHEPALFRRFGALEATEEAFQVFADQHGALGPLLLAGASTTIKVDGRELPGESLEFWEYHAFWMRHAIQLWDALRPEAGEEGERRLDEWLRMREVEAGPEGWVRDRIVYLPAEGTTWGERTRFVPKGWGRMPDDRLHWPKGPRETGTLLLSHIVNVGLQDTRARVWMTTLVPTLGVPLVVGTEAYNLIGAMWLQLALAIEGNLRYKPCERCGRWFHVPPKAKVTGSKFCSDSCRVLSYRERKAAVLKLAKAGKDPREIAKETGAKPASVRKWIREAEAGTKPARKGRVHR